MAILKTRPMAEIEIKNLRKEFGEFVAVQDSTFKVEDGEFYAVGSLRLWEDHNSSDDGRA